MNNSYESKQRRRPTYHVQQNSILANPGTCLITYINGEQECHNVLSGFESYQIKKANSAIKEIEYWPQLDCKFFSPYYQQFINHQFINQPRMVFHIRDCREPDCTCQPDAGCEADGMGYCIEVDHEDGRGPCSNCFIAYKTLPVIPTIFNRSQFLY